MKKTLTFIIALLAAGSMNAQILYKITGKDAKNASYIIGTYHLADASFTEKIPGLQTALAETEQVYGEVNMENMMQPASIQKMTTAMMLPEGQTLKTVLTPEQFGKVSAFAKELMGVGLDNDMVFSQLGKMSPKALATQFTLLLFIKNSATPFNPANGLDNFFQMQAKQNNKPIGGLETVDFQIETLYKSTPIERQVEELICLVDNKEYNLMMVQEISKAFYAQDLQAIEKAADEKLNNSCDSTPEEEDTLIYGRNDNWMKLMPSIMAEKPTFFAVGALHLVGERGMLAQLQKAGYTVTPCK